MAAILYRTPSGQYLPRSADGKWVPRQVIQRPGPGVVTPAAAPPDQPQRTVLATQPDAGALRVLK